MTGNDILKIRAAHDLTQEALAMQLGVTVSTVFRWEKGKRKPQGPARKMLEALQDKARRANGGDHVRN